MTTDTVNYFSDEANQKLFQNLIAIMHGKMQSSESDFRSQIGGFLKTMLQSFVQNGQRFDELCQVNIKLIGPKFKTEANNYVNQVVNTQEAELRIFLLAYRFLCELQFSQEYQFPDYLEEIKVFVLNNFFNFSKENQQQIAYIESFMPGRICREMISHPNILMMREFLIKKEEAVEFKKKWDLEYLEQQEKVEALKHELKKNEDGFNFVGLVSAFRWLAIQKKQEKNIAFNALLFLGCIVILPLVFEVIYIFLHLDTVEKSKELLLYFLPPLVGIEILLVYFFRIVLTHFRSIKAQLLQLELRTALCQFIQRYAEYSNDLKKNNSPALEKFESLIFSGLLANDDQLPSTFDGIEQLSKLFKSAKPD